MKTEIDVLDSQLDLLKRINSLPDLLKNHIGDLPQSFLGGHNEICRIKELCETLEFIWKKWIFETIINNFQTHGLFEDVKLAKSSEYIDDEDL